MTPDELVAWRKERKITQGELARLLGVGMITISRWERGVQTMSPLLPLALEALNNRLKKGANEKPTIKILKINEEPKEE